MAMPPISLLLSDTWLHSGMGQSVASGHVDLGRMQAACSCPPYALRIMLGLLIDYWDNPSQSDMGVWHVYLINMEVCRYTYHRLLLKLGLPSALVCSASHFRRLPLRVLKGTLIDIFALMDLVLEDPEPEVP